MAALGAATVLLAPTAYAEPATPVGGSALATKGLAVGRGAPPLPAVSAAGWVVADADTGEVLAARDPHGRYLPASTMKTLTAVAVIPTVRLNYTYVASPADVNIEGSKVGLVAGMRYPIGKLLEAMLVVSGNDAANALATANLVIAKTVAEMSRFGLEPRHLRAFRAAADREVGLVEQVVAPLVRQRNPEARGRAEEVARELGALSVRLHAMLVKAGLRPQLGS